MLKKIGVIIVLSFLVITCSGSDKLKKPNNLITKDKMADVLHDLYVINAAKGINRKMLEENGFMPETYVLTKHSIDSTQFADSNTYYSFDPETYAAIIDNVKKRLEKEKAVFEKLQKEESEASKIRRDSVKKDAKKRKDSIQKIIKKGVFN